MLYQCNIWALSSFVFLISCVLVSLKAPLLTPFCFLHTCSLKYTINEKDYVVYQCIKKSGHSAKHAVKIILI